MANAAFVEMNMTTSEGYKKLYFNDKSLFPIRYMDPNCGPANKTCVESKGNADLTEHDIERMADYARWLGNPTRSEFQVVSAGSHRGREDLQAIEVRYVSRDHRESTSIRKIRC